MSLLEIKNLSISFGGIRALSDIDLTAEPGEITAIIGPNGSGKTTLFNCISGVYKPEKGDILFKGKSLLPFSPNKTAAMGIARTFQNLRLFSNMTVLDNLLLGRHIRFKKNPLHAFFRIRKYEIEHRRAVEQLIEFLQLEAYRKARISDCPYGIRKRAELGRSLAMNPLILMIDEPVSGLTSEEKDATAYLINEIKGRFKPAVLLVEHDLKIAFGLADKITVFDSGKKIAQGLPKDVRQNPDVIRSYIGGKLKDA